MENIVPSVYRPCTRRMAFMAGYNQRRRGFAIRRCQIVNGDSLEKTNSCSA